MNEATIKKYIRNLEKHDKAIDKLTSAEYSDPFKGKWSSQSILAWAKRKQAPWDAGFSFRLIADVQTTRSTGGYDFKFKPK